MSKLQPTYGRFKVRGIVTGLDKDYAWVDSVSESSGRPYRIIRFNVKTSETNQVQVELVGSIQDNVYFYNREEKKSIAVNWDSRYEERDDGYELIGVQVGLEKDDKGKNIIKTLVPYDATKEIYNNLKDGDSVYIVGRLVYSEYETNNGNKISQVRNEIQRIYFTTDPVDFNAENFKEINDFKQDIIVVGSEYDKELNKLFVNTYIVTNKEGDFVPYQFTIDGEDKKLHTLLKNIKALPFGSLLNVEGKILNKVETVKIEDDMIEEDIWGDDESSFDNNVGSRIVKEMTIRRGIGSSLQKALYSEEDFIKDDGWIDIDDEDLPF